jgi:hypothetical protein
VTVTGAKELRRAMKRMGADLKDLTAVNRAAAQPVLEESRRLVPRVSGTLGRSIRLTASRTGASVRAGKAAVPYAGPIHFGWRRRNIEANPFLYRAIANRHDEVLSIYNGRVEELVGRLDRETPE